MRKYSFILFMLSVVLFACNSEKGEPYTILRKIGDSTVITPQSTFLYIQAKKDVLDSMYYFIKESDAKTIAYNADISTEFYDIDFEKSVVKQYGHVWTVDNGSINNEHPTIDKNDHTVINGAINSETFKFSTTITGLGLDTFYWVRSYVITDLDTGYNPNSIKIKSGIPDNVWFRKKNFGGSGRIDAVSFNVGSDVFIGTGYDGINVLNDIWKYDIVSDTWTQVASLTEKSGTSVKRRGAVAFVVKDSNNDYIAMIGSGNSSANLNNKILERSFAAYNVTKNQMGINKPFVDSMPEFTNRENAVAFVVNNKAYVGLGNDETAGFGGARNDFYVYDITQDYSGNLDPSWQPIKNFDVRLTEAIAITIGDKVYVGTGIDNFGNYSRKMWTYDFQNFSWNSIPDMPEGTERANGVGFSLVYERNGQTFNRIYIGTGRNSNGLLNDFYAFDLDNTVWVKIANCGTTKREGAVSFTVDRTDYYDVDKRGYVALGQGIAAGDTEIRKQKDVWEYLP